MSAAMDTEGKAYAQVFAAAKEEQGLPERYDCMRRKCACLARGRERVCKDYGNETARLLFREFEEQFGKGGE